MAKTTTELLRELKRQSCSLPDYLSNHKETFVVEDIKAFWEEIINKKGYSKSNIINKSDFSYCYFYDVINGRKMPTKDKVVRLALAMKMNIDECQQALKISGRSALYPKVRRDSVLIYAIEKHFTVTQCNDLLAQHGEDELK
mgnify:CR=1 FL=1